ncbi:MAG: hypothetical protein Q9Q40_08140 [Acidobacteriota bacterium]|nr:hypothetical protein [Acidobacteriota bacterium]MDQ7086680.1 hypothetical protein [Acidobacteriota bacterium]
MIRGLRPAGQVLLYRGHRPGGVFVLLAGSVRLEGGEGEQALRREIVAPEGAAVLLQLPTELDAESPVQITVAADADLVFVPGTLIEAEEQVARALGSRGLRREGLLDPEAG